MDPLAELIGQARSIVELRAQIRKVLTQVAQSRRFPPILLQGETGAGKGLVADVIHRAGPRSHKPFVDVNCAAIPETLLEAELFGFERGAFTDARRAKAGLLQSAEGGTILLDEIALLSDALQAKLLKVIETRTVRRLGSTRNEPVDVSIVAATNEDLLAAVQTRRFREDLYHRLAVLTLHLPPLRERSDDIPALAEHFLARACADYGLPPKTLTPAASAALLAYRWPGNVRELANVMERAALLTSAQRMTGQMLGLPSAATPVGAGEALGASPAGSLDVRIETWERQELLRALEETGWNVSRAAVRLGISRNTIRYRIARYDLHPPAERTRPEQPARVPRVRPPVAAALPPTAWERRLVALLRATPHPLDARDSPAEFARDRDVLVQKVESFAGRIEEAGRSGLVAAFGLEPAEDAPRRAALAAMAIQNALARTRQTQARRASIAIAIHADQCLVGQVDGRTQLSADAKHHLETVLGDLSLRTPPDSILVSKTARPFLDRRFDFEETEARYEWSGRGDRLLGYHQVRFGLGGYPGPFVGREHELVALRSRWQSALHERGQIVALVGEAGVGKSRLLFEFRQTLSAETLTDLEGHGESYGGGSPYLPVIDLLKGHFRVDEDDDPPGIRDKVTTHLLAVDPALSSDLSSLLALLHVPVDDPLWQALDPPQRRQRTLDALRRLVLRESQLRPVLLVVEDLHWIDAGTQAFLDRLVDSLPTARLLLVVNYRPEYQHGWGGKTYYTQLRIDPLPPESTDTLLDALLGNHESLTPLKPLLIGRTEGNPFFLEESVRTLVETRALVGERGAYRLDTELQTIRVPASVHAVLAARIDRLAPREKRLLEAAAVIGKDVPLRILQAVADLHEDDLGQTLARLQTAELLYESQAFGDLEYTFKHSLTHEVAYASPLPERRRTLHARIVGAIEGLYRDRLIEQVERLAHHSLLGELWQKAVAYCRQAGAKAVARSAHLEAATSFEQALAALPHLPESDEARVQAIEVRFDLRTALTPLGELGRMLSYLREAVTLAEALGDQRRLARASVYAVVQCAMLGDYDEGGRMGERALAIATRLGDVALEVPTNAYLALVYDCKGEYRRAIGLAAKNRPVLEGALRHERFDQAMVQSVLSRNVVVRSLTELGQFGEAIAEAEDAMLRSPRPPATRTLSPSSATTSASCIFEREISRLPSPCWNAPSNPASAGSSPSSRPLPHLPSASRMA